MTRRATSSSASGVTPEIEAAASAWFARRDAGLEPEQRAALERWLHEDPRHAAAFAQVESAWSTFGRPARCGDTDLLLAELATRRVRRRRRRGLAAGAMLALVLLGLGTIAWRRPEHLPIAAPAVVHRPEHRSLPDGSAITLRGGAEIAVAYTAEERRVTLQRGEALFEVAKDPTRPFIVRAHGIDVRAVGTAFVVQAGAGTVDVLVTEGTVRVEAPPARGIRADGIARDTPVADLPADLQLTAGHRVVVSAAASPQPVERETLPPAEIERRLGWRAARVEFSGTPLVEAVALLNREAGTKTSLRLRIVDRNLEAMRVSGLFRADDPETFVLLLEAGFGVRAEREGDVFLLRPVGTAK